MRKPAIPIRVSPEIYEKFKNICAEQGVTMSAVGAEMIEAFCDDVGVGA